MSGCAKPYVCSSDEQCVDHGVQGMCAPQGFCGFPDSTCTSGYRFESEAGGGLAGTCVVIPAQCGGVGQACCPSEQPCGGNAFCQSGTCAACVTDVAFGQHFSCALKYDHSVWCSGENGSGQLGLGMITTPLTARVQVIDASGPIMDATSLGAGRSHACALRAGGSVWCWGENSQGQLGNGVPLTPPPTASLVAVQVVKSDMTPLTGISVVRAGEGHSCALDGNGGMWCWGGNFAGQLGDGSTTGRSTAAQVMSGGAPMTGVVQVSVGGNHNCARTEDNMARCWGQNGQGQLGDGTTMNQSAPTPIYPSKSIAAGMWHSCGVQMDGTIKCSGESWKARLGHGETNDDGNQPQPVTVLKSLGGDSLSGAIAVAAGGVSCALMADHTAVCWGDSQYGQDGNGAGGGNPLPVITEDGKVLTDIDSLVAGHPHVCAKRTNGELLCWGRNQNGDLGDGTTINRGFPSPLKVACP
jgi:alpha-tubulin suppressor-like RCC1 family protein